MLHKQTLDDAIVGPVIKLSSGNWLDPYDPDPERIFIDDIAQGLANICRFNGQCRSFYSVAEHSVAVSMLVETPYRLAGLLHDAAEAYLGDVPRPLKYRPEYRYYRDAEEKLLDVIWRRFRIIREDFDHVIVSDQLMLKAEMHQLMDIPAGHPLVVEKLPQFQHLLQQIHGYSPPAAKSIFLTRFFELMRERDGKQD